MKIKMWALVLGLFAAGGCHSKLLDHSSGDDSGTYQDSIGGIGTGAAPEFNIPTPAGFSRSVFFGAMPASHEVQILDAPNSTVFVFIHDLAAKTWFKLGTGYSGAFYYERPADGQIVYRGTWLAGKEYCVYQYVPIP